MSRSNKISIICLLLLTTSLIAIGTFTFFTATRNDVKYLNASNNSNLKNNEQNIQYLVKEYNGKVAIFRFGENEPEETLDIDISSLPLPDRTALKEGISMKDSKKLNQLIEDFDG